MGEEAHSALGASSAHRWMNCPGSVAAEAKFPDRDTPASREGTDAHALAAACLRRGLVSSDHYVGCDFEAAADAASVSGIGKVEAEMTKHLDVYLRTVWDHFGSKDNVELYVEEKVYLDAVRKGMFGTADTILFNPVKKEIRVVDLKYGIGTLVEVDDNEQLQYYALAALLKFHNREVERVHLTIVQPRAPHSDGPVRTVTFDAFDLLEWMLELRRAVEATTAKNAPRIPGEWCKFCKASGTAACPELREQAVKAATDGFGEIVDPEAFDAVEMGKRLAQADLLDLYVKKLRSVADDMAKAGRMPLGFKWVAGRGTRKWTSDNKATLAAIEAATAMDISETVCPSPAQAQKILGPLFKMLPDALIDKAPGNPKLVREGDKRPALGIAEVNSWKTEGFDNIETE